MFMYTTCVIIYISDCKMKYLFSLHSYPTDKSSINNLISNINIISK